MSSSLECKICGGTIVPDKDGITGKCESCGTVTVIPKSETNSSKLNRANYLRRANEFDKAMALFEEIVKENDEDSEAYWGLVLCKYGIEYVDDVDGSKKPTCHRTMFNSILDDPDYKAAIDNALGAVRYIYEDEAKKIDEIQKKIKSIAANEKPYDIFICYKEGDEQGQRTRDSVDAQEIYNRLTSKGYKVFFARKTLQNKLGSEYEPLIFAALSSAKIMLVYGSKPEFFNAVWVKNEWSRFRRMMAENKNKKIIPIYDGSQMSAYDLPNELVDFQAFDKYRVGFMEDLIDGLEKMMKKDKNPEKTSSVSKGGQNAITGLMDRAKIFVEDGMWDKANIYYEKVLDSDPQYAPAYIGKFLVEHRLKDMDELENMAEPLGDDTNYKKALRFAEGEFRDRIEDIVNMQSYKKACAQQENSVDVIDYNKARKMFEAIKGYKDADERAAQCGNKIDELNEKEKTDTYSAGKNLFISKEYEKAKEYFVRLGDYKDCAEYIVKCNEGITEAKYQSLLQQMDASQSEMELLDIEQSLRAMGNYKDCVSKAEECAAKAKTIIDNNKRKALIKKLAAAVAVVIVAAGCIGVYKAIPYMNYNKAAKLMSEQNYSEALTTFQKLGDFKDSAALAEQCSTQIKEANYKKGFELFKAGNYEEARSTFDALGNYKDSAVQVKTCENAKKEVKYKNAVALLDKGDTAGALNAFRELGDYKDSKERVTGIGNKDAYDKAMSLYNNGSYAEAKTAFLNLGDYKDSSSMAAQCAYQIDAAGYKQAYIDYLNNIDGNNLSSASYYIGNIVGNAIPELMISLVKIAPESDVADNKFIILTYSGGSVSELYNNSFYGYGFEPFVNDNDGKVYFEMGGLATYTIYSMKYNGGRISISEYMSGTDVDPISNYGFSPSYLREYGIYDTSGIQNR